MTVLFVMRHAGYVRNFESVLRMLCDRGHRVQFAFQGIVKHQQLGIAVPGGTDASDLAGYFLGWRRLRA
jgi:hypothetical protein